MNPNLLASRPGEKVLFCREKNGVLFRENLRYLRIYICLLQYICIFIVWEYFFNRTGKDENFKYRRSQRQYQTFQLLIFVTQTNFFNDYY